MALSDMPADVEQAFNTLLQAELNHRRKQQQAESQQAQQKQLMQLESQKLSNQMFQNALKGQLETKSLQLKSAQQQSDSTLEMYKFLSEQEDKRLLAREKMQGQLKIREMATAMGLGVQGMRGTQAQEQIVGRGEQARLTEAVKGTEARKTEVTKHEGRLDIARLNNSAHLKRMNEEWGLKTTFTVGREAFKEKQSKLHRDMKTGIAADNRASKEEIAKKGRALQRHLQKKGQTWKSFENALDRKVKESIANLRSEGKDKTRENSVKSLRDLEDMYKTMAAVSAGADVGNLGDAKHNDESRAYMAMMAAVGTAATEVANAGGDWKVVLKKYLETNEVRIAIETSSEAHARFRTMELMLQGVSAPGLEVQGEEIPTGGGSIPTGPGAQGQSSREAAEAAARQRAIERRRNERGVK